MVKTDQPRLQRSLEDSADHAVSGDVVDSVGHKLVNQEAMWGLNLSLQVNK